MQFEKNTYSSIAIGTSTTIIISNARIVRESKLRVAITLGYVCESAKGVTEVGKNTNLPCRSISVWEGRQVNSSSRSVAYTIRFPCRRYAWFLSKRELHQKTEEEDKASRHSAIDSVIMSWVGLASLLQRCTIIISLSNLSTVQLFLSFSKVEVCPSVYYQRSETRRIY